MLIGQGAIGAANEIVECAEKLGAGVAALADDLPFVTGPIGLLAAAVAPRRLASLNRCF